MPESFLISKSYNQKVQNERDSIDPYLQQRSLQTPELKPHISESSKQLNGSVPKNKKQRLREYTQKALKKSLQQFVVSEIDTLFKQKEKSPINYSPQDEQNLQGCQGVGKEQVNLRKITSKNQTVKSVRRTPYDKYHDIIQQQENEIKRGLQTTAMKEWSVRKISFN